MAVRWKKRRNGDICHAERNYRVENIKIILIFFVIFGHLLESIREGDNLYKVIYSFHMPVFIFINGWCVTKRSELKRTILRLAYSYVLLQLLYTFFNVHIINSGSVELSIQFTTPYWLLWYLMTLLIYYLFVPVISTNNFIFAFSIVAGSILLAVMAGFDTSVGYYMSLSRTIVFFPYFVCGYYVRNQTMKYSEVVCNFFEKRIVKAAGVFLLFGVSVLVYKEEIITTGALYGSYSYESGEFSFMVRLGLMCIAFIWIFLFFLLIPDRKIFERADTFPIYALHGFIVLYLRKYSPFIYSFSVNLLIAALISVVSIVLLGNKYMSCMTRFVLRGEWIETGRNGSIHR